MRSLRAVLALTLAGGALVSCGRLAGGADDGATADRLDGRSFLSTAVTEGGVERPLVPGTRIELSFSDGRLSARVGCNLMGAGYRIEGGTLRLVGGVSTTEMGCDPERHEQDEWLMGLLGDLPRVTLEGSELVLVRGRTQIRLLDREVAEPDLPLLGTTWTLDTIVEGAVASSVPAGLEATLRAADGRIGGFDGCNEWGARLVSSDGGVIVLGRVARTLIACTGAAERLERDVMAVIGAHRIDYGIDGPRLVLRVGERELHWLGEPVPSA